jgi:hypothetical protein
LRVQLRSSNKVIGGAPLPLFLGVRIEPNFVGHAVPSIQLLDEILAGLRSRYASLNNLHYEAAWTDSWVYCRCFHNHPTLIDAAKCGMPQPGFYVLAVEGSAPRELTTAEEKIVNDFRFAALQH